MPERSAAAAAEDDEVLRRLRELLDRTPPGAALSQGEIAREIGYSRSLIFLIEKSALKKLRASEELREWL